MKKLKMKATKGLTFEEDCNKQYPKEKRNSVTYFVSDMWRTYADISAVLPKQ